MKPSQNIEKLIEELVLPGTKVADERVLNNALSAFERAQPQESAVSQPYTWRISMKTR